MQNAGIASLKLNWRYLAFDVDPQNLREAIAGAKRMGFIGVNLTVPHKLLAMDMVDALDDSAKSWGAVNTIRFEGRDARGNWKPLGQFKENTPSKIRSNGFNTDADAIVRAIREDLGIKLRGAKVLLLGAGGAGRVAALKLAAENVAQLFLVNRTTSKAEVVAAEISTSHPKVRVKAAYPAASVDLVLNATSLGLKKTDAMPFDEKSFSLKQTRAVYDMIYRPAETPLLKAAKAAGCRVSNGSSMLLYQGAKALEIWTRKRAPLDVMRRALEKNIYGH